MQTNETNNEKNINADLVVIGSGGGLASALAATESGLKNIIVLERQNRTGGNTALAGDIFACDSPVQKRANINAGRDEYFKIAMRWAHWNRVNPRIVRKYINKSGNTISWLEGKGIEFEQIVPYRGVTTHNAAGSNKKIMKVIAEECENRGIRVMLNTRAKKIIREENGNITGITAESSDGEEIQISCSSVIIATGGFPGNPGLLKKYCPEYHEKMHLGKWPNHTGDGLVMAEEIGAKIANSIPMFHIGPVLESGYWGKFAFLPYQPYMIWINKKGKRFIDESWNTHWESGNAVMSQPEKEVYIIWDDKINSDLASRVSGFSKELKKLVTDGSATISDNWDGIAEWTDAEPSVLLASIAEYNSDCANGCDEFFAKNKNYLIQLDKPPYYAVRAVTHCGETMGGIVVNENMEVLDINNNPLPGLFAAGVITDGWQSQTYCTDLFGSACSYALNSGRIAGENAADYVLKKIKRKN